jgi:hypothetical protein
MKEHQLEIHLGIPHHHSVWSSTSRWSLMRANFHLHRRNTWENQAFKAASWAPVNAPVRECEQKIARAYDIHIGKILRRFRPHAIKHREVGKKWKQNLWARMCHNSISRDICAVINQ